MYEEAPPSELAGVDDLSERLAPDEDTNSPDSSAASSATSRKFRKSFSLRLTGRASQDEGSRDVSAPFFFSHFTTSL